MDHPPKALFFDVFGTLVNWRVSIAREAELILKPLGHDLATVVDLPHLDGRDHIAMHIKIHLA